MADLARRLLDKLPGSAAWSMHRYWRRTICPHGYRYTETGRCQRCPYPRYGYKRRITGKRA